MLHHHVVTRSLLLALLLASAAIPAARPALAIDSTCKAPLGGSWGSVANWTDGIPNGIDDVVRFAGGIGVSITLCIDNTVLVPGVTVGAVYCAGPSANTYQIYADPNSEAGSGKSLIFDSSSGMALIQCDQSTAPYCHTVSAPVQLNDPVRAAINAGTLHITGTVAGGSPSAGITKTGAGVLWLEPQQASNRYTGPTVLAEGILTCTYSGLPDRSNLVLGGGRFEPVGTWPGFGRALGAGENQVHWTGSCAIIAHDMWTINLGGAGMRVTWGQGYFVPDGAELVLGSSIPYYPCVFENPIDLGGAARTVRVATPYSISSTVELSGALSNGSLLKVGDGILTLSGTNSYGGPTVVGSGTLRAMPGVGLPNASNLVLAGGTFETVDATTFARALGTGTNQVQWTGSGGFSALSGKLTVNIGGNVAPDTLTWGTGFFVPSGSALLFGSGVAQQETQLLNPIDLAGAARTVGVGGDPYYSVCTATLSGGVLGTGGSALVKTGIGTLKIGAADLIADSVDLTVAEGTLDFQTYSDTVGVVTLAGGTITGSGVLTARGYEFQAGEAKVILAGAGGLTKSGPGLARLATTPAYTGETRVAGGILGFRPQVGLPPGNINLASGVLSFAGTISRNLGTEAGQLQWTGSAGFACAGHGEYLQLNLNGGAGLVWGTGGFVPAGSELVFCSADIAGFVRLMNAVDLAGGNRSIRVDGDPSIYDPPSAEVSGVLSNGGVTKTGNCTLELTAANTYGGPTTVMAGNLRAADRTGLPAASNLVLAGGYFASAVSTFTRGLGSGPGQVQWTGSGGFAGKTAINLGGAAPPAPVTWGAGGFVPDGSALAFGVAGLTGTDFQNPIDLGGAAHTVTVGTNATATLSGVLSNGGLTKSGPGWLIINNTNTFAGTVAVAEGTLEVQNAKALGSTAGSTVVANGACLWLRQSLTISGESLVLAGAGPDNTDGALCNDGGDNTWSGPVSLADTATIACNRGALRLSGPLDTGGFVLTLRGELSDGVGTISGTIRGGGGIVKTDNCTWVLGSTNTYTGLTVLSKGTLRVTARDAVPPGSLVLAGGTLELVGSTATCTYDIPGGYGQIVLTGGALTVGSDAGYCQLSANISGTGNLTKKGAGWLYLVPSGGTINYSGLTTIEGGVLIADDGTGLSQSSNLALNGGTLGLTAGNFTRGLGTAPGQIRWLGSGGFANARARGNWSTFVTIGSTGTVLKWGTGGFTPDGCELLLSMPLALGQTCLKNPIDFNGKVRTVRVDDNPNTARDYASLQGQLSGNGGLNKAGPGMLELNSQNTYTGATIISEGGLRPNPMTSLPTTSNLVFAGGVLEGTGAASFTRALGTAAGQVQWTGSGGFSACTGKMVVNLGGHAPADVLTWNRNGFVPNGSYLVLGSGSADSEIELKNPIDLAGDTQRIFVPDNPYVTTDLATISGAISNGSLVKDGSGLLVLKGSHTYTGATTVAAGTLKLAEGAALASTALDVQPGATLDLRDLVGGLTLGAGKSLKGGGTVLGDLVVGGTLSPGGSPGILSVEDITFAAGSILNVELGGTVRGGGYDALVSSGDVVLQNGSTLSVSLISSFVPQVGDEFDILDFSSLSGRFTTINLPALAGGLSWSTDDLYLDGTIGVTPEPATLALLALGGLGMLLRRRRK